MYLKAKVRECDFTGNRYYEPVDGANVIVVSSASGRACCVMTAGPEYLKERGIVPKSYEEVVAEVLTRPGAWVDF